MDYMVEGISEKDSKMNLAVTRLLEFKGMAIWIIHVSS